MLPGFKLGDTLLQFLHKYEQMSAEQCDQQVEELLELIDDVELRMLKAEVMHQGMTH